MAEEQARQVPELPFMENLGRGGEEVTHKDHLIFGRSGAGKTYWISTAPQPIYLISIDPRGHMTFPYQTPGFVAQNVNQVLQALAALEAGAGKEISTVALDGWDWFYNMLTREMGWYLHNEEGTKDPDLMPIHGYKKVNNLLFDTIRRFVNLTQLHDKEARVHFISTALDERLKEDDEAEFLVRPNVGSDTVNNQIVKLFSIVTYIWPLGKDNKGNETDDRGVIADEVSYIQAKDRFGIFPKMGVAGKLEELYNQN